VAALEELTEQGRAFASPADLVLSVRDTTNERRKTARRLLAFFSQTDCGLVRKSAARAWCLRDMLRLVEESGAGPSTPLHVVPAPPFCAVDSHARRRCSLTPSAKSFLTSTGRDKSQMKMMTVPSG
jgi:hypothetical protein